MMQSRHPALPMLAKVTTKFTQAPCPNLLLAVRKILLPMLVTVCFLAGAVEFLMGGWCAFAVYLLTGLAGAWSSFQGHGQPPLSVGASGAIFGLLGSTLTFIIRRRKVFRYAQRWKVWRVYVPLFVLLFLPALANADAHAHLGGFALGLLLGWMIPPHPRVPRLAAIDPLADDDEGSGGDGLGQEETP